MTTNELQCRHCGQAIEQGEGWAGFGWYHKGSGHLQCDGSVPPTFAAPPQRPSEPSGGTSTATSCQRAP
jgi:hypothetical protein